MCHQAGCGCRPQAHSHAPMNMPQHRGGCCCEHHHPRHFQTREETVRDMEDYLKQLQAEAGSVAEKLAELKKNEN